MAPRVEVITGVRSWRRDLESDRSTVGKAAENDIPLDDDATASHLTRSWSASRPAGA
jgi:hypothetical protein